MNAYSRKHSPWPISTVGEHFDIQLGKMLDAARNVGDLKPYLGNRAVQWGRIDLSAVGAVPLTRGDQARYRLKRDDLLVCEGGEVGRAAIWRVELRECYYQKALHRLRPKADFDSRVMLALLEYWSNTNGFTNFVTKTSIGHLPRDKFLAMPLPIIPVREQQCIADTLDDVNNLIAALERSISKKQAIKQGVMQQLLTGKTRLPGFETPWSQIRLGDHVSYVKTIALSRAQLDSRSTLRYLHYGDIHTSVDVTLDAADPSMPRARSELARRAGRLQVGDLVFADASEDPNGVGKSVEIISVPSEGVVPGLHTIAARFDKAILADGFKAYFQFIPAFRNALVRVVAGTKVLATTRSHISSVELALPAVSEQAAIARTLHDSDHELGVLHARLAKAKAIKQGMMQELLTGRTRLPVEEAAG